MKKLVTILLSCVAICCFTSGCSSCNNRHSHTYDQQVTLQDFLASKATCTEKAKYYYSCKCGAKSEEIFEYGELKNHTLDLFGICATCNQQITSTQGITYEFSEDGSFAIATGYIGTDINLIISIEYQGVPVTTIGNSAFMNSTAEQISIPSSVTHIESGAFQKCANLKRINISENVCHIANYAFFQCVKLETVNIGNNATYIGDFAFYGCTALEELTIGDNVSYVGNNAFQDCTSLTRVTIGKNVAYIGVDAFNNCCSLETIELPNNVTTIGNGAFEDCSLIKNLTIGNNVTIIGIDAFEDCSLIESLTIGNNVISIDSGAFEYCSALTTVYYVGSEDDWAKISISSFNNYLTCATRYYYVENENDLPTDNGNYWHYVGNVPTVWTNID